MHYVTPPDFWLPQFEARLSVRGAAFFMELARAIGEYPRLRRREPETQEGHKVHEETAL